MTFIYNRKVFARETSQQILRNYTARAWEELAPFAYRCYRRLGSGAIIYDTQHGDTGKLEWFSKFDLLPTRYAKKWAARMDPCGVDVKALARKILNYDPEREVILVWLFDAEEMLKDGAGHPAFHLLSRAPLGLMSRVGVFALEPPPSSFEVEM